MARKKGSKKKASKKVRRRVKPASASKKKAAQSAPTSKPTSLDEAVKRMGDKQWFSTPDMQRIFGCHEITVYRWVQNGELSRYRARASGKRNRYSREDVERFAKGRFSPKRID